MKAFSKENAVVLVLNLQTLACIVFNVHTSHKKNYGKGAASQNSLLIRKLLKIPL